MSFMSIFPCRTANSATPFSGRPEKMGAAGVDPTGYVCRILDSQSFCKLFHAAEASSPGIHRLGVFAMPDFEHFEVRRSRHWAGRSRVESEDSISYHIDINALLFF